MASIVKPLAVATCLLWSNLHADSLELYAKLLQMDYTEYAQNGAFLDSEKSDYSGITGAELAYLIDFDRGDGGANSSSLTFMLSYLQGKSNYDGFLQSSNGTILGAFQSTTDNNIIEPKIRWSETTKSDSYDVSLFTSVGYRYWSRDIGSQYGYKEEYKWAYGDVGVNVTFHEKNWHLGFEGAYKRAYKPTMHASLNGGSDFDLGRTSGYDFSIPLRYDLTKSSSVEVVYVVDRWDISASNVLNGYSEPDSTTKNKSIKLGYIIKW